MTDTALERSRRKAILGLGVTFLLIFVLGVIFDPSGERLGGTVLAFCIIVFGFYVIGQFYLHDDYDGPTLIRKACIGAAAAGALFVVVKWIYSP